MGQIALETLELSYQGEFYYPSRSTHNKYESTTGVWNVEAGYLHGRRWLNVREDCKYTVSLVKLQKFKAEILLCSLLS